MSAFTTIVAAFVLAILVATLMWGGAGLVIALPVVLVGGAVAFALNVKRRHESTANIDELRDQARAGNVEFTERDEQTLVSE